ncbi:acetylglutamate kinase [Staphylococcus sp. IVB6181]|uniref:acetylglutamate kinase n=1 Tax=Staphylococcus sp. IVB6181 TaxID=2929481 RepID=UPI0021D234B0|nr:acetylglutamate kinase [Staphylococcus sp. IVB6181]UXV35991.1 acetylglutamate kinase [Staphylococcus sp. IVB6181]
MKYIVFKIGGSIIEKMSLSVFEEIAESKKNGYFPIIIHGGGPMINKALKEQGIASEFENGIRKTDLATLKILVNTLLCKVNVDLVEQANTLSQQFIGINGAYFPLFKCHPFNKALGYVAVPDSVNTEALKQLCSAYIPIMASVGRYHNQFYNVNADTLAYKVASALKAPLVILSDIPGVLDNGKVIPTIQQENLDILIQSNIVCGGMIPKLKDASEALDEGCPKVMIVPGYEPHIIADYFKGHSIVTTIQK